MTLSKIIKTAAALSVVSAFALASSVSADAGYGKLDGWAAKAGTAVDKVMTYPSTRTRGSGNGTAIFRVTVDQEGDVIASEQISRRLGAVLNAAARKVVRKADFPALPSSLDGDSLTFELQLSYGAGGPSLREADLLRPGRVTGSEVAQNRGPVLASLRIVSANAD